MIYASCRKDFEDVNEFAPVVEIRVGGEIEYIKYLPRTIQVHGYNSQFRNVADAYRANVEMMREAGIVGDYSPAGFFWPGLGENPLESLLFHRAQGMASKSAPFFKKMIDETYNYRVEGGFVMNPSKIYPVVIAHSLGCQVALEAAVAGAKMKALVLLGAAVDNDCLEKKFAGVKDNVEKVVVCWSKRDEVLCKLYHFDQLLKKALGCSGPTTSLPWVESVDVTPTVASHNEYRFDREVWRLVSKLV